MGDLALQWASRAILQGTGLDHPDASNKCWWYGEVGVGLVLRTVANAARGS